MVARSVAVRWGHRGVVASIDVMSVVAGMRDNVGRGVIHLGHVGGRHRGSVAFH